MLLDTHHAEVLHHTGMSTKVRYTTCCTRDMLVAMATCSQMGAAPVSPEKPRLPSEECVVLCS